MENPKTCTYRLKKNPRQKYRTKQATENIRIYGTYQSRKSFEDIWGKLATDQLDFRFRCNLSQDTGNFRLCTVITGVNG